MDINSHGGHEIGDSKRHWGSRFISHSRAKKESGVCGLRT